MPNRRKAALQLYLSAHGRANRHRFRPRTLLTATTDPEPMSSAEQRMMTYNHMRTFGTSRDPISPGRGVAAAARAGTAAFAELGDTDGPGSGASQAGVAAARTCVGAWGNAVVADGSGDPADFAPFTDTHVIS